MLSRKFFGKCRGLLRYRVTAALAAVAFLVAGTSVYSYDATPDVFRVEEDWELILDAPSDSIAVPQLMTVMSPKGDLSDLYGMVTWNYREIPSFYAGGLQLQSWADDLFLYSKNFRESEFSTAGETITWTQSLKVANNILTLQIKNGQSVTWGAFGGTEMQLSELILVNNLNGYSPETSVDHSAVTYGAYRVVKLRIKEVRYFDADNNLITTDGTSRVVHARPSNN